MRYVLDCRETLGEKHCTVSMAADTREEVLESAIQHAVSIHRDKDSEQLRQDMNANILEREEEVPAGNITR